MSENKNIKGQLLKPNTNKLRAQPIKFNDKDPFKYKKNKSEEEEKKISSEEKAVSQISAPVKEKEDTKEKKLDQGKSQRVISATPLKKSFDRTSEPAVLPTDKPKRKPVVGKNNSTKTLKVPTRLHTELNVLGKFMDENKTYAILDELIEYYVENQLTERQQKQFRFISDFTNEE